MNRVSEIHGTVSSTTIYSEVQEWKEKEVDIILEEMSTQNIILMINCKSWWKTLAKIFMEINQLYKEKVQIFTHTIHTVKSQRKKDYWKQQEKNYFLFGVLECESN